MPLGSYLWGGMIDSAAIYAKLGSLLYTYVWSAMGGLFKGG